MRNRVTYRIANGACQYGYGEGDCSGNMVIYPDPTSTTPIVDAEYWPSGACPQEVVVVNQSAADPAMAATLAAILAALTIIKDKPFAAPLIMQDANGTAFIRQILADGTIKDTTLDGATPFTPVEPVVENCPCKTKIEEYALVNVPELAENSSVVVVATLGLDPTKTWVVSITSPISITYSWVIVNGNVEVTATNNTGALSAPHSIEVKAVAI